MAAKKKKKAKKVKVCVMVPRGKAKTVRAAAKKANKMRRKPARKPAKKRSSTRKKTGYRWHKGLGVSPGLYKSAGYAHHFKRDMMRDWYDDTAGHRKAAKKGWRKRKTSSRRRR